MVRHARGLRAGAAVEDSDPGIGLIAVCDQFGIPGDGDVQYVVIDHFDFGSLEQENDLFERAGEPV